MEGVPQGYKYIGCLNWFYSNPPELYKKFVEGKYKTRIHHLGRCWELYICDELKICWDVDSSD